MAHSGSDVKSGVSTAAVPVSSSAKWFEPKWDREREKKLQSEYWWSWTFEDPNPADSPLAADAAVLYEMNSVLATYKAGVAKLIQLKERSAASRAANGGVLPDEKAANELVHASVGMALHTVRAALESVKAPAADAKNDAGFSLAVSMFVDTFLAARTSVLAQATRLETIQNTPNPELVAVTEVVKESRARLEDVLAPRIKCRIPWPLFYVLFRKAAPANADGSAGAGAASESQKSDFEGGQIRNKDGTLANEVRCKLFGHVIQYWDLGRGNVRYRCMEADRDHSAEAHQLVIAVRTALLARAAAMNDRTAAASLLAAGQTELCRLDPHMMSVWVAERDMNAGAWLKQPVSDSQSPAEFISAACKQYANRLCIGVRNEDVANCVLGVNSMTELNGYSWLTFDQAGSFARGLAYGLRAPASSASSASAGGGGGGLGIARGSFVGICGANQPEWLISDFACALSGCVIVGIHTTYDQTGVRALIQNAQLVCVIASRHTLPLFVGALPHCPTVKHLIVWEDAAKLTAEERKLLASTDSKAISVHHLSEIVARGTDLASAAGSFTLEPAREQPSADPNSIFTLLYTSGSTGTPKGVIVTKRAFRTDIGANITVQPLVGVSYIPLSHSSDRVRTWEFIGNGGRVGFASYGHNNWEEHEKGKKHGMIEALIRGAFNNVHTLMSSIQLIQPCAFAGPPRIWNGLYNVYHTRVAQLSADLRRVLSLARECGLECVAPVLPFQASNFDETALAAADTKIRASVRAEIVALFGSRLMTVATGGAPTSPEVMAFIRYLFPDASFHESYGATEVGAITENGIPRAGVELKLMDLPAQGFTNADRPHPRGEIVVRTSTQASGYYRAADQTKESFVDGGWFRTGDLGSIVDPHTKQVAILERVSAVTALSGGLLICPSKLEAVFESSKLVQNVFVYGDKAHTSVVAVVQPSGGTNPASAEAIRADFNRLAAEKALRPHEIPIAVHVSSIDWSVETGLLNIHHKKMRAAIYNRFQSQLKALYSVPAPLPALQLAVGVLSEGKTGK